MKCGVWNEKIHVRTKWQDKNHHRLHFPELWKCGKSFFVACSDWRYAATQPQPQRASNKQYLIFISDHNIYHHWGHVTTIPVRQYRNLIRQPRPCLPLHLLQLWPDVRARELEHVSMMWGEERIEHNAAKSYITNNAMSITQTLHRSARLERGRSCRCGSLMSFHARLSRLQLGCMLYDSISRSENGKYYLLSI